MAEQEDSLYREEGFDWRQFLLMGGLIVFFSLVLLGILFYLGRAPD